MIYIRESFLLRFILMATQPNNVISWLNDNVHVNYMTSRDSSSLLSQTVCPT